MSDDEEMREAPPSAPADAGGQAARRRRYPSRVAVVSVAVGALVIGGAGLGLALSDAGAAAPAPASAAAGCISAASGTVRDPAGLGGSGRPDRGVRLQHDRQLLDRRAQPEQW